MNITPDTPQPSVTERIARIRLRMRVEQVTGIATVHKEAFLPLCLESEVKYKSAVDGIAGSISFALSTDREHSENWPDDWDDWPDKDNGRR